MAGKNAYMRYRVIDNCLRNAEKKWTKSDIYKQVNSFLRARFGEEGEVTESTIRHDLDDIEYVLQAPLERYPEKKPKYYRYSDPEFSLFNVALSVMDNARLTRALETLSMIKGLDLAEEVEPIIYYLQNKTMLKTEAKQKVMHFDHQPVALGQEYIEDILSSINQKTPIKLNYRRFTKEDSVTHLFHPYVLKEYNNRWFCLGYCSKCKQIINIGLDRLEGKISLLDKAYIENSFIDTDVYFNDIIGVTHPANVPVSKIRFKISKERFPYIKSKPIHQSQTIEKVLSNGEAIIVAELVPNKELLTVLLGFGSDIELLEPKSLVEKLYNNLHKAISKYQLLKK